MRGTNISALTEYAQEVRKQLYMARVGYQTQKLSEILHIIDTLSWTCRCYEQRDGWSLGWQSSSQRQSEYGTGKILKKAILSKWQRQEDIYFIDSIHHQCLFERRWWRTATGSSNKVVEAGWCIINVSSAPSESTTKKIILKSMDRTH